MSASGDLEVKKRRVIADEEEEADAMDVAPAPVKANNPQEEFSPELLRM
jgi:hypothetical protein